MPFSNVNASVMLGMLQVMVDRLPEYLDGPHVFADVRLLTIENLPYAILSISTVLWHSLEVQRRQGELSTDDHILIRDTQKRLEDIKVKYSAQYQTKLRNELTGLVAAWTADVDAEREAGMAVRALPADLERRRTQIDRLLESVSTETDVSDLRRKLRTAPAAPGRARRPRTPAPVEEE
ncbi:MAG: hypothetical protein U0822_00700 [Anaerolineae bacterium]